MITIFQHPKIKCSTLFFVWLNLIDMGTLSTIQKSFEYNIAVVPNGKYEFTFFRGK